MFCDKCGNQLNENEKVCPNCGNAIEEVQPNVGFTGEQPQNTAFTPQQSQGMPYAQPTQPPKKKVDILKLLPIISNAIGVVSGILSVIFGIYVKNGNYGTYPYYIAGESYGGDAYTGIQNAVAHTANNVRSDTFCQGCLRTFFAVIQNQTLDFVAHGFFARFTEMDFDAVGGLSDFLYHYRWRGFLYGQRGSGCGGAAVAGVVVHRLSFP